MNPRRKIESSIIDNPVEAAFMAAFNIHFDLKEIRYDFLKYGIRQITFFRQLPYLR
jgi:hypothetical protein